jgi:hypothetical protein
MRRIMLSTVHRYEAGTSTYPRSGC